jgi:hypothetical protein
MGRKTYTDAELIEFLHTFEKIYGVKPTAEAINKVEGYPSAQTYSNRFGSWSKAMEIAGYDGTHSKHYLNGERVINGDIYNHIVNGTAGPVRRGSATNFAYETWRNLCLSRDKYRCVICAEENDLNVHHVLDIRAYPYQSAELANGVTLCKSCHSKVHKGDKEIQNKCMEMFLNNRVKN